MNGKYCPDRSVDCRNFVLDADCCICDTIIGRLYSQVTDGELDSEMKFEMRI